MNESVRNLIIEFSNFSKKSVILKLSALNLLPENHAQKHRIRVATQAAILAADKPDSPEISSEQLADILEQEFPEGHPVRNLEDPQETLFTDLVMFHGGNHIIFPEIFADSHICLRHLLDTIFMVEREFPEAFRHDVYFAVSCLLSLSDQAAQRMGYERYMTSPFRHQEAIFFPNAGVMANAEKAIQFEYQNIAQPEVVDFERREKILESLTCDEKSKFIREDDIWKNPLQTKPLYRFDGILVVTNLSVISTALVHFIVCKIYEYKLYLEFVAEYRQVIYHRTANLFKRIDFTEIDEIPRLSKSHPLHELELCYRFDDDKLAWVTVIPDLFASYNMDIHFTLHNSLLEPQVLQSRRAFINDYLANRYPDHEFLFIEVYVPMGREYRVIVPKTDHNDLHLSYADLDTIFLHDGGSDGLLFWRYILAEQEYLSHAMIQSWGFLDRYTFYREHRQNFYFTDEARFPNFGIQIGFANEFRAVAKWKSDAHLQTFDGDTLIEVHKRFPHKEIPIYLPIDTQFLPRMMALGEKVSFWVHLHATPVDTIPVKQIAWNLAEAMSYWLWQLTPSVEHLLPQSRALFFEVILLERDKWNTYNFDENWEEEQVIKLFKVAIRSGRILIAVPFEFAHLINGWNNINDRVLVRAIVFGLNMYFRQHSQANVLDAAKLVERHAPLGKKSMILGFDTISNPMLHEQDLPDKRIISHFEIERLLNDLAIKCASGYPVGPLTTIREKNKLCHAVVAYFFKELQELVAHFPYLPLLKYLIRLNESLWRARHMAGEKNTSRLACFGKVASMRDEIIDEALEIEEATIAVRCLIEIVIASPPFGSKTVNNRDIDTMIALSKEITTWGTISDELSLGVNEMEMGILPSGRIGTGKEFINSAIRPYNLAKRHEAIDEQIADEELRAMTPQRKQVTDENVDPVKAAAFQAEFGYDWETYLDMIFVLIELGYSSKDGVNMEEEAALVKAIQDRHPLSQETIANFLSDICLISRPAWNAITEPYTMNDVYPWKYSRALSLMRRPLAKVVEGEKIVYYWGLRQVALAYQYLDTLIETGRYRYKSPEMGRYIGQLLNAKGKKFTKRVYDWLSKNYPKTEYVIDHEVSIDVNGHLKANKNFGDIDILIIDLKQKKILSIECKHLSPARITSEFATELKKFEAEWIGKHLKRHKWLSGQIPALLARYQLDPAKTFELRSIFLTSEKVPYPFMRKTYNELPFYDFSTWSREPELIKKM